MQYILTDLPKYIKINSRQDFQNAVIKPNHALLFSQDGQSLTAKLSDGSFVTMTQQTHIQDTYNIQGASDEAINGTYVQVPQMTFGGKPVYVLE